MTSKTTTTALMLAAVASSLLLSDGGVKILQDVKRHAPDVKFVISSNLRGTDRQASALVEMLNKKKSIHKLYKAPKALLDDIKSSYDRGEGVRGIEKVLDKWEAKGVFMSTHSCGRAIDIYPYKTQLTMKQLFDKVKYISGYKVLNEGNHIHIQDVRGCK